MDLFSFYRNITITNSGTELSNFKVKVELDSDNFYFYDCRSEGQDIKFIDSDDEVLSYYKETFSQDNFEGSYWVTVPYITASGTHVIKMYYGLATFSGTSISGAVGGEQPTVTVGDIQYNQTNWFEGVTNKFNFYIDSSKIDEDLTSFPVLLNVCSSTGIDSVDTSSVFDVLTNDEDRYKIAVTATVSGIETPCFVDIEYWNSTTKNAALWVGVPSVVSGTDTTITLYYDTTASGNTDYVGDSGGVAAAHVWNYDYRSVWHLADEPSGETGAIIDACQFKNNGTAHGTITTGDLVDGPAAGKCLDFDGWTDYIEILHTASLKPDEVTMSVLVYKDNWVTFTSDDYWIDTYYSGGWGISSNTTAGVDTTGAGGIIKRGSGYIRVEMLRNIQTTGWRMFTMTYDGRYTRFYMDGILYDTNDYGSDTPITYSVDNSLVIGASCTSSTGSNGQYWNDLLDEPRISKVARSAAWLKASYNSKFDLLLRGPVFGPKVLNQISSDSSYVYAVTTSGLDIVDIVSESVVSYIARDYGFTTVWCSDDRVYLGTTTDGVKYIDKACVSGTAESPSNIELCLNNLQFAYGVPSNIRYLHGNGPYLMCITDMEIDVLRLSGNPIYRSTSTSVSGNAYKGFMTSTGKFYYTLSGTQWSVERLDTPVMDWGTTHASHASGGYMIGSNLSINDIFATEQTSSDEINNTLFIATSSGVYVIDEGTNDYAVYYTIGE